MCTVHVSACAFEHVYVGTDACTCLCRCSQCCRGERRTFGVLAVTVPFSLKAGLSLNLGLAFWVCGAGHQTASQ